MRTKSLAFVLACLALPAQTQNLQTDEVNISTLQAQGATPSPRDTKLCRVLFTKRVAHRWRRHLFDRVQKRCFRRSGK
jgi:hypothetical protein